MKKSDKSSKPVNTVVTTTQETLTVEEDRVLRMRSGYRSSTDEKLASKLDGVKAEFQEDLAARLALMQAEVLAHLAEKDGTEVDEERQANIVSALSALKEDS